MITIYKINKIGYLLHGSQKTKSGIVIASEPFIKAAEDGPGLVQIAEAISKHLANSIDSRLADIKDWSAYNKDFLQKIALTSSKALSTLSTKCLEVSKTDMEYLFTPTFHDPDDNLGYIGKNGDFKISVSASASIPELVETLVAGFDKCN